MVEDSSGMEGSLGRRMTLRRLNVAEARGWILGVVDFSVEALGSWNTCHHPDEGRILTTTDAPHFLTCRSLRKGSRRCEDTRTENDLKLIMTLVRRISLDHCEYSKINCCCTAT